MEYVILGNGIAGVCAAETIRQFDTEGGITMVADETFPPYSRPMISMVLAGQVESEKLPIRSSRFYEDLISSLYWETGARKSMSIKSG